MHTLFIILILAISIAFLIRACFREKKTSHRMNRRFKVRSFNRIERISLPFVLALQVLCSTWHRVVGSNRMILANTIEVREATSNTKLSDEVIGRYTLVKAGSDEDHIGVCDAADIPLGSTTEDSASAAEKHVAFDYFGCGKGTRQATASGAIEQEDFLVPADDGKLRTLPEDPGTYWIVGRAIKGAADGKDVIYVPSFPIQRVVE